MSLTLRTEQRESRSIRGVHARARSPIDRGEGAAARWQAAIAEASDETLELAERIEAHSDEELERIIWPERAGTGPAGELYRCEGLITDLADH